MNAVDWLARRARIDPHKVALLDAAGGLPTTYGEWNARADRLAAFLHERGVRKGDRVAALSLNRLGLLDLVFACGKLGAIHEPLNFRLAPSEIAASVRETEPAMLFYGPEHGAAAAALPAAATSCGRVAFGEPVVSGDVPFAEAAATAGEPPEVVVNLEDPWILCQTGGTTGTPKAAILTHRAVLFNALNTIAGWGLRQDDVAPILTPLFHTGGLNVLTTPLAYLGGTSILVRSFDPDTALDVIERHGATVVFLVPAMFAALARSPRFPAARLDAVRLFVAGGAPCPRWLFDAFLAKGRELRLGYGLTEAGPNNFALRPHEVRAKPGSVGHPLPHVDARVVDAEGNDCGPDEVGELRLRGPHLCAGYWKKPEETAGAFAGGWLRTGDLARRDADGCHTIVGRIKEMIISGGENVYPAEVEDVLAAHGAVAEAAVIGVPDPKWGEAVLAVVALREGAAADDAELIAHCRGRLGGYKIPRRFAFVTAIPKTAAGKVDRSLLRRTHGGR